MSGLIGATALNVKDGRGCSKDLLIPGEESGLGHDTLKSLDTTGW